MSRRTKKKQRVNKRDDQGRPIDVNFTGNPAAQCPACLGHNVEPVGPLHFVFVGDGDDMAPVTRMRCRDCRGRWWRPGL